MALNAQQNRTARLIYQQGLQAGLNPARARELVAAAYAESGLNPRARNTSSGAAGLFQLLSSGYVNTANRLGGVYNPVANVKAILPQYVRYWQQHPNAAPGEGGRDVEISGQGAGFYARPLSVVGQFPAGAGQPASSLPMRAVPSAGVPAPPQWSASPQQIAQISRSLASGQTANRYAPTVLPKFVPNEPAAQTPAPSSVKATHALGPDVPATHAASGLVSIASQQLGQPYVWGGESRKEGGFDCSGLVDWSMRQQGYHGPRLTTYNIAKLGQSVKGHPLQPGDLVLANGGEHVVIYAGKGRVIAAPHTGTTVQYQPLSKFHIYDVRRV